MDSSCSHSSLALSPLYCFACSINSGGISTGPRSRRACRTLNLSNGSGVLSLFLFSFLVIPLFNDLILFFLFFLNPVILSPIFKKLNRLIVFILHISCLTLLASPEEPVLLFIAAIRKKELFVSYSYYCMVIFGLQSLLSSLKVFSFYCKGKFIFMVKSRSFLPL